MPVKKKADFFTYKNRPLVRKGNTIYYGNMSDEYVAMLTVVTTKSFKDVSLSDKILVQLISTDPTMPPQDMVAKRSERTGLFQALDVADVWLNRKKKEE